MASEARHSAPFETLHRAMTGLCQLQRVVGQPVSAAPDLAREMSFRERAPGRVPGGMAEACDERAARSEDAGCVQRLIGAHEESLLATAPQSAWATRLGDSALGTASTRATARFDRSRRARSWLECASGRAVTGARARVHATGVVDSPPPTAARRERESATRPRPWRSVATRTAPVGRFVRQRCVTGPTCEALR